MDKSRNSPHGDVQATGPLVDGERLNPNEAGKRLGRQLFTPANPWFVGVLLTGTAKQPTLTVLANENLAAVAENVPASFHGLKVFLDFETRVVHRSTVTANPGRLRGRGE
jgi:hypothetical protein